MDKKFHVRGIVDETCAGTFGGIVQQTFGGSHGSDSGSRLLAGKSTCSREHRIIAGKGVV